MLDQQRLRLLSSIDDLADGDADVLVVLARNLRLAGKTIERPTARNIGKVAVVAAMEAAGAPDDGYQIGRGPAGLTIGIGPKPCCARLQELYGNAVQWFSPDEIAAIIEMDARFKKIVDIKRAFPGAEMKG